MATTNLDLTLPTVGGDNNAWGTELNTIINAFDSKFGSITGITTAGGNTNLTQAQQNVNFILVVGALVSNASLSFIDKGGLWIIKNGCTGAFTLTAKVVGQTGVVIPQGATVAVVKNGTDIQLANTGQGLNNVQVFTASGTYTPTANATKAIAFITGGGGGGGGVSGIAGGGGGGGGGATAFKYISALAGALTVTIGAAGAAGSSGGGNGGAGGQSALGTTTANGGFGGTGGADRTGGAGASTTSGATLAIGGGAGGTGGWSDVADPQGNAGQGGTGGSSFWGGGGVGAVSTTGSAGLAYGSGGGGAGEGNGAGGAGKAGVVVVIEF